MLGGHLDSVLGGPGLNDNGSGVATLLALAESVAAGEQPQATVRFGFWGAEEFGDIGSGEYVASLSEAEGAQFERTSTWIWSARLIPATTSTATASPDLVQPRSG